MAPLFVASLSLVPGIGHWIVGKRRKAAALFAVDFGIVCWIFLLKTTAGRFLTFFAYLMVMAPAVIETYALAQGGISEFSESKPYIVTLLLLSGLSALPLLWQSGVFSQRSKITWSIIIPVLAILHLGFLGFFGMGLLNE